MGATVVTRDIRRAGAPAAQLVAILAIPALNAAAPMRTMRASASNAAHLYRLVNVRAAVRWFRRAPSFAHSAASLNRNAAARFIFND